MPTPAGLPKKGDRIKHVETGVILEVVKREGSGLVYAVIAKRLDGQSTNGSHHPYGYSRDHVRITSFSWMLSHGIYIFDFEEQVCEMWAAGERCPGCTNCPRDEEQE